MTKRTVGLILLGMLLLPSSVQFGRAGGMIAAGEESPILLVTIADAREGVAEKIDAGAPGDSPGDMFVFDQPLLDLNRQPIGTNSGFCVRTLPAKFSECQWTLTFKDGTITVAGREADVGTSSIPIVGGSGVYLGITGALETTPNGDRTYTQKLTLHRP